MSVIWLPECPSSPSHHSLVNSASAEMFVIWLPERFRTSSLVKPASAAMSVIWLSLRLSHVRLMANSNPVKSLMPASSASKVVKVDISPLVIVAPLALPSAAAIAARSLASGMVTGLDSDQVLTTLELEQLLLVLDSPATDATQAP